MDEFSEKSQTVFSENHFSKFFRFSDGICPLTLWTLFAWNNSFKFLWCRPVGSFYTQTKPFSSDKLLQGLLSNLVDLVRTWYDWIRMSKIFIKCQPSVVIRQEHWWNDINCHIYEIWVVRWWKSWLGIRMHGTPFHSGDHYWSNLVETRPVLLSVDVFKWRT